MTGVLEESKNEIRKEYKYAFMPCSCGNLHEEMVKITINFMLKKAKEITFDCIRIDDSFNARMFEKKIKKMRLKNEM